MNSPRSVINTILEIQAINPFEVRVMAMTLDLDDYRIFEQQVFSVTLAFFPWNYVFHAFITIILFL